MVEYHPPRALRILSRQLQPNLAEQLNRVWTRNWNSRNIPRIRVEGVDQYENLVSWNIRKLEKINDLWFRKLARHVANYEFCPEIDAALRLHLNDDYEQIKRYVGHLIFAQVSDKDIAKQWELPVKTITALRMLFFDFTSLPKSPVARWGTLVQWVNNGDIKPDEFALYKRVHEMGELGLKAQVAGAFLNDDERLKVKDYLTKSATSNTFNIQFSTRTPRDAVLYNRVIGDLVRMDLQREELKLRQCEQRLMDMQVQKISKEMNIDKTQELQSEDLRLIQSAINLLSKEDSAPRYKTIFNLEEVK